MSTTSKCMQTICAQKCFVRRRMLIICLYQIHFLFFEAWTIQKILNTDVDGGCYNRLKPQFANTNICIFIIQHMEHFHCIQIDETAIKTKPKIFAFICIWSTWFQKMQLRFGQPKLVPSQMPTRSNVVYPRWVFGILKEYKWAYGESDHSWDGITLVCILNVSISEALFVLSWHSNYK